MFCVDKSIPGYSVLCTPCMACRVRRVWCVAYVVYGVLHMPECCRKRMGKGRDGRLYDEFQRDVPSIFVATTFW